MISEDNIIAYLVNYGHDYVYAAKRAKQVLRYPQLWKITLEGVKEYTMNLKNISSPTGGYDNKLKFTKSTVDRGFKIERIELGERRTTLYVDKAAIKQMYEALFPTEPKEESFYQNP